MILQDLPARLAEAADAAEALVAQMKQATSARVSREGRLDRRVLDAEQHVAHGLAWAASYAETLRQTAVWAKTLDAEGRLGEAEALPAQLLAFEYLSQLAGGVPMNQGETFRPADLGLDLTARQAQLAAAESDYRQQETDLARYQGLLAQHFISQAEFDRRASGVVVAREKVKQARADLAVSQNRRAYATLTAERDGVVSRIDAEPGQVVQAGQTVVTLAVPGEREAVVNVPEARLAAFRTASAYSVQLWNDGRRYPATLRELAPVADPVSRTYQARLSIPAADDAVKLGMSATVFVTGRDQPAQMRLPLTAVLDEQGRHAVWVLDGKTLRVKKRAVTLAGIDSQTVTVASGVRAGETVVTAGVHLLRDGMRVRRLDPSPRPGKPALAQVGTDKATASGGQP